MIITISGTPGSGKSTVGKRLAKRMGYKFYSAGDVRGKYALAHGLSINQLNKQAEKDPATDKLVDEYLMEVGQKETDFVVDARLGFFFIPQSIKVFLDADPKVRAERIFKESRKDEMFKSPSEARRVMERRVLSDKKRLGKLYGVDLMQESQYDMVLDTTTAAVDEIVGQIYRFTMFRSNPSKRE